MRFSPIAENPTLLLKNSLLLLKRTGSELSASSNVCLLTTIGDFRIIFGSVSWRFDCNVADAVTGTERVRRAQKGFLFSVAFAVLLPLNNILKYPNPITL